MSLIKRSVSVSRATFDRLDAYCASVGRRKSEVLAEILGDLGTGRMPRPKPAPVVAPPPPRHERQRLEHATRAAAALEVRDALHAHRRPYGGLSVTRAIPLSPERLEDVDAAAERAGVTPEVMLDVAIGRMVQAMIERPVWCRGCCESIDACECKAVAR